MSVRTPTDKLEDMHSTESDMHSTESNIELGNMRLHAIDVVVGDTEILTDAVRLHRLLIRAADASRATVLGQEFVSFANGAVTGVLVLAQSHLSIHTWPELSLANVDFLTYGRLGSDEMIEVVCSGLQARAVNVTRLLRSVPRSPK